MFPGRCLGLSLARLPREAQHRCGLFPNAPNPNALPPMVASRTAAVVGTSWCLVSRIARRGCSAARGQRSGSHHHPNWDLPSCSGASRCLLAKFGNFAPVNTYIGSSSGKYSLIFREEPEIFGDSLQHYCRHLRKTNISNCQNRLLSDHMWPSVVRTFKISVLGNCGNTTR